jgi:AraC-like DNA-binding protein
MEILGASRCECGPPGIEVGRIFPEIVRVKTVLEEGSFRCGPFLKKHWVLAYAVNGKAHWMVEGAPQQLMQKGSVICLPPNLRFSVQCEGPEPIHVLKVVFHLDSVERRHLEWKLSQSLPGCYSAHGLEHLERQFSQIIQEATTPSLYQPSGLQLALDALILEVLRGMTDTKTLEYHPAILKALRILKTRFNEDWTVSKLSIEVGLSQSRLAELFNKEVGSPVHRFLVNARVKHAEMLLTHSDLTIRDVAAQCGFATIQHFSRVFKGVNGRVPTEFRQQLKGVERLSK